MAVCVRPLFDVVFIEQGFKSVEMQSDYSLLPKYVTCRL